jgi:hypothetical protein
VTLTNFDQIVFPIGIRRYYYKTLEDMADDVAPNEWTPANLGVLPRAEKEDILTIPGLSIVSSSKISDANLTDKTVKNPQYDALLKIWSASPTMNDDDGTCYLALLDVDVAFQTVKWEDGNNSSYPSGMIFIPKAYEKAASILFAYANSRKGVMTHMLLGDISGIGKTFFARYLICR